MKILALLFLSIFMILNPLICFSFQAKVLSTLDGDTILVKDLNNDSAVKIRLYCIDSPEKDQLNGDISKQKLEELLTPEVDIIPLGGSYDRIVGIVISSNLENINLKMVKTGYSWVYSKYCKNNEYTSLDEYIQFQHFARNQKLGIWKNDNNIPPWEWRHK